MLAQPRALVIAAAIALGMGLIPGMPTLVFAILALAVGTVGLVLLRSTRKVVDETGVITEISSLAPDGQKPEPKRTAAPSSRPRCRSCWTWRPDCSAASTRRRSTPSS